MLRGRTLYTQSLKALELARVYKVLALSYTLSLRMIPLELAAGSLRIGCGETEQGLHVSRLSFLSARKLRPRRWVNGLLLQTWLKFKSLGPR